MYVYIYIYIMYIYLYIYIPKLMCIGTNLKTGLANSKNYSIILGPGSKKEPEFPLSNFPLSEVSKASYLGSFQYSNSPRLSFFFQGESPAKPFFGMMSPGPGTHGRPRRAPKITRRQS